MANIAVFVNDTGSIRERHPQQSPTNQRQTDHKIYWQLEKESQCEVEAEKGIADDLPF